MAGLRKISRSEAKRVGKFGAVGVLNTALDFGLYNILSSKAGLILVQANVVSTTVAMIFSFMANRHLVFAGHGRPWAKQAIRFFLVTAFGLYVLQTGTIHLLTEVWLAPMNALLMVAHTVGIQGYDEFIVKNGAKVIATAISLTWNYVLYKGMVFI